MHVRCPLACRRMPLATGTTLSHYTILGPLGAGAMGEVLRAKDTELGREVPIKVPPEHFADEPERLKRFEREATTLASLNHPNVAQIFGVDQVGEVCFLVLEFVPGESLDERSKRGPLPLDEALDVAKQIAEGLEAAHEAGVIRRDSKPANVLVTPDGRVMVLDFGLAKTAIESLKGSSTDNVLSTEAGRLLGTPTYMAPEQARGKGIDKRVDIWAFGCVLYECLTAQRASVGDTMTDVLGSVLHTTPARDRLPADTPRRVRDLLARCFEKDPRRRLRDIGDARLELEAARVEPANSRPEDSARASFSTRAVRFAPWVLCAALAGAATFFALRAPTSNGALKTERSVVRATLVLPKGMVLPVGDRFVAVSPDGTQVVVSMRLEDGTSPPSLHVRDLSRLEYRALSGTEEAAYPFWSPDGQSIAFFAGRKLKRVDLADGIVRSICDAGAARGGVWGRRAPSSSRPAPWAGWQPSTTPEARRGRSPNPRRRRNRIASRRCCRTADGSCTTSSTPRNQAFTASIPRHENRVSSWRARPRRCSSSPVRWCSAATRTWWSSRSISSASNSRGARSPSPRASSGTAGAPRSAWASRRAARWSTSPSLARARTSSPGWIRRASGNRKLTHPTIEN